MCISVTIAKVDEKAPVPINLLHFAFSMGTLIAPATVAHFLSNNNSTTTSEHEYWKSPSDRYGKTVIWSPRQIYDKEFTYTNGGQDTDVVFNTYDSNLSASTEGEIFIVSVFVMSLFSIVRGFVVVPHVYSVYLFRPVLSISDGLGRSLGASHLIPRGGGGGPGFGPRVIFFFSWGWSTFFCLLIMEYFFFLK